MSERIDLGGWAITQIGHPLNDAWGIWKEIPGRKPRSWSFITGGFCKRIAEEMVKIMKENDA